MAAPNGTNDRVLALVRQRGEATSHDIALVTGQTVVQVCTQLRYLEAKRKVYRAGLRRDPRALRPAIVYRPTQAPGEALIPAGDVEEFIARNPSCYEVLPPTRYVPAPYMPVGWKS